MAFSPLFAMLEKAPIVAILRGITPGEVVDIAGILLEHGIRVLEVPLNSPEPLKSIEKLRALTEGRGICGAGTVLDAVSVSDVANAGGQLIISPNTAVDVIDRTRELGLTSIPGCMTPSEAFTALRVGAHALKIFPASTVGPAHFAALKSVLPTGVGLIATGGVSPENIARFGQAGAVGFGIGSDIYKPGDDAQSVGEKARNLLAAL